MKTFWKIAADAALTFLCAVSVLSLVLALSACGGALTDGNVPDQPPGKPTPTEQTTEPDPYDVYLELAPTDAPELSREDAQTRALLGCDTEWAPGTVDAALAEAYAELCK